MIVLQDIGLVCMPDRRWLWKKPCITWGLRYKILGLRTHMHTKIYRATLSKRSEMLKMSQLMRKGTFSIV